MFETTLNKTSNRNLNNFKLENFTAFEYFKRSFKCKNDSLKERTFNYLNSLRSIEYLLNSYSELTFYKSTQLTDEQHLAIQLLPIFPEEQKDFVDENIKKVNCYLEKAVEKAKNQQAEMNDMFLISNFSVKE